MHYRTIGTPRRDQAGVIRNAVLLLHARAEPRNFLVPDFAGQLFEQGQLLDGNTHFIIIPDAIGTGGSSSRATPAQEVPRYDYADSARAAHADDREVRVTTSGCAGHVDGAMQAWMWAETYPSVSDAFVALASNPSRCGTQSRLSEDDHRCHPHDPGYDNGEYTKQPRGLVTADLPVDDRGQRAAAVAAQYRPGPVDTYIEDQVKAQLATADANDTAYRYDASRNYDPSPGSNRSRRRSRHQLRGRLREPAELGIMERAITRVKHGRFVLVPITDQTRGHRRTRCRSPGRAISPNCWRPPNHPVIMRGALPTPSSPSRSRWRTRQRRCARRSRSTPTTSRRRHRRPRTEAGVWVIAETTGLPTKMNRIVVTTIKDATSSRICRRRPTTCGCAATAWSIRRR